MKSSQYDIRFWGTCAVFSMLLIIVNFAFGLIAGAIGVPGASGFVTGFTVPFFLVSLDTVMKRFGGITVTWTLYSLVAIPLSLMGPPNPFKPLIGICGGLAFDIIIYILVRVPGFQKGILNWLRYSLGMIGYTLALMGGFLIAYSKLNLPGKEAFENLVFVITIIFCVEGLISVALALKTYRKFFMGTRYEDFYRVVTQ